MTTMTAMEDQKFYALVARKAEDGACTRAIEERRVGDLPPGEVLIRVRYSSLNYKDALSAHGNTGITKHYPHTPGIDAAGVVAASTDPAFREGEEVICTGYDLGMNTDGGMGQYIRVPAAWVVRKPEGLSLLESMRYGTAGFTAVLSVLALRDNGVTPESGEVLVSGATGGVGSVAVHLLSQLGYRVCALSGKIEAADYLRGLGAIRVESPKTLLAHPEKLLLSAQWAGAVDTVGGPILAAAVRSVGMDGVVTCCGNAASEDLPLNVYPFILRGVHLIGIYAAASSMPRRMRVWQAIAERPLPKMAELSRMVSLGQVPAEMENMLAGKSKGRVVVDLQEL